MIIGIAIGIVLGIVAGYFIYVKYADQTQIDDRVKELVEQVSSEYEGLVQTLMKDNSYFKAIIEALVKKGFKVSELNKVDKILKEFNAKTDRVKNEETGKKVTVLVPLVEQEASAEVTE